MNQLEKLELRDAAKTWASLTFYAHGRVTLDHNLTEYEVKGCPGLGLYNSSGHQVRIELGGDGVLLSWPDGRTCTLGFDVKPGQTCTDLKAVVDSKGQVRWEAKANGLGGRRNAVITLNLHWVETRRL